MTQTTPSEKDVLAAAAAIVDAFSATDGERYFSLFAPEATFVFHTEPARLDDRAAYERMWQEWVASGWRVTSCASSAQRVQLLPGGAVFTHSVSTSVETPDGPDSYQERETIVFRSEPNGLIAIHEHLSPQP
ncbi:MULTISPECIES: nuclear transport factor 2 family protein [unclassified Diaminobutyricimonas]|uniref:YybH family protein n=1 Tax=unclassified Diaminobutyricimonas TaxID=2643261 RepID=UPI0012F4941D|nr:MULTISPECIES: nuclear transport factor 2 family protein [unclassified Diaminobutyricimonas]